MARARRNRTGLARRNLPGDGSQYHVEVPGGHDHAQHRQAERDPDGRCPWEPPPEQVATTEDEQFQAHHRSEGRHPEEADDERVQLDHADQLEADDRRHDVSDAEAEDGDGPQMHRRRPGRIGRPGGLGRQVGLRLGHGARHTRRDDCNDRLSCSRGRRLGIGRSPSIPRRRGGSEQPARYVMDNNHSTLRTDRMASTTTENLEVTSEAVAGYLDAPHVGAPVTLDGIDSLDAAGPRDLAFCIHADPAMVAASNAGAVVCPPAVDSTSERAFIHHGRPQAAFIRVARALLLPTEERTVHPTATVAEGATVGRECHVGPGAYIDGCVTLEDGCSVGAGSVLGTPGFGYTRGADGQLLHQPHVGTVVVKADAEVGPNCVIDRAVFDRTVVGEGAALSGGVHLAHQARVGARSTVAFGSGFAGGATLGEQVTVHPGVTVATDVVVGDGAELGMGATVLEAVPADTRVVGTPAGAVGPAADGP